MQSTYVSRALLLFVLVALVAIVSAQPHSHVRRVQPFQHRRHHQRNLAKMGKRQCTRRSTPNTPLPTAQPTDLDSNGGPDVGSFNATSSFEDSFAEPSITPSRPSPSPTGEDSSDNDDNNNGPPDQGGVFGALFPVPGFSQSWSTSPSIDSALPLSDDTLRPHNIISALPRPYVPAPDGKHSLKAHFPEGSYTFGHQPQGGWSFYAPGPASVDITSAREVTFGYSVFFEDGFAFQKGGKLPGIYGGNSDDEAVSCSGGRRASSCFSARLMWRAEAAGEFYTYLPPFTDGRFSANKVLCDIPPYSECNPTYGASVGRGSFSFDTGRWVTVAERVRLNDVGEANGRLELFVDGRSVVDVSGLILRDNKAGRMRGIQGQTFFGGNDPSFATPKDQDIYFSDFSLAITEYL